MWQPKHGQHWQQRYQGNLCTLIGWIGCVQVGSCEIKMCQVPVGSGNKSLDCQAVSRLALNIIQGSQKGAPAGAIPYNSGLTIAVEKSDPNDSNSADCGSPTQPCRW